MDLNRFLKSQTFKTGAFILLVLFVLLMVFKTGFIHGYKKAIFPHKYSSDYSQTHGETFFDHYKGTGSKDLHEKLLMKKKLIIDKESAEEDIAQ